MTALLELSDVTKSFGAVKALRGVSFDLRAGEVHALVGENGAGKSTLIKIVTGAHQPDGGVLKVDGQAVEKLTPASAHTFGIAAIYQQPALLPELSIAENMALGLEKRGAFRRVRWSERRRRARELLSQVGASLEPDREVGSLSMPEQQLVEIARALGAGARILIMDEPTASLTAKEVDLLLGLVKDLRSRGVGIIYISHRLPEVFEVADRVTVLRDGGSVGTRSVRPTPAPENVPGATRVDTSLTESELIRMMVGRELSVIFPPSERVPGEPLLSVENLSCRAGGIDNVSFQVRSGEIFGLAGLVGAGRTELARVLFGLTPADSGTIRLGDKVIKPSVPREALDAGIAYLPEDRRRHGVVLEMSIANNVTMGIHRRIFPLSWLRFAAERRLAEDFIRDLSIKAPSAETVAGNLSGGNQQKVALARWLAASPRVLILDEPTQGVDVGAKAEIHKLIRRLAGEGLAVLMISSELPEILGMSDRIGVMRAGRIITVLEGKNADAHSVMRAALAED